MITHEWVRGYRYWEAFFAVVTLAVLATIWAGDETLVDGLVATTAVAVLVILYLAVGRRIALSGSTGFTAMTYQVALIAVLVSGAVAVADTSYLLFAIVAHVYWIGPMWFTVPLVVALNFVPLVAAVTDGATGSLLPQILVSVTTASASVGIGLAVDRIARQSLGRADLIEQLRHSRAEVARLSRQAGVAAERERLAADIHDTVTQALSSIVLLTQAARTATDPAVRDERLRLAEATARAGLAESREIVAALTPGTLTSATVADAIGDLAAEHGADFTLTGEPSELSASAAVVMLRSAQEALRNTAKHAPHATSSVRLDYDGSRARLTVTDSGPGFDVAADTDGFGLRGMRNRAASIGGECTIDSGRSAGTTVTVEVPV